MISRAFDEVGRGDLEALIANSVSERRDLEFKRDLPGETSDAIKEFLADVTSLANAQGGDLIFGIEEKGGVATALVGLTVASQDETLQRLENTLRDSIDPKLIGVKMEWIPLDEPIGAIIIRVPASLAAPHRVRYKKSGLFFGRNSRGKYEMDAQELRVAFTQSEQLPEKIRQLHADAVEAAGGRDMPFALNAEPAAVVSIIPLALFREARDLAITRENVQMPVDVSRGVDWLDTLEGVLMHTAVNEEGRVCSYALTHRDGRVDVAWTIGGALEIRGHEHQLVWPKRFEEGLLDAAGSAVARLRQHGLQGPWVVLVTVIGVLGYQLMISNDSSSKPAWRDRASMGALVVDQVDKATLQPLLKAFWLLFGQRRP
ncbi:AlbA family DNA-binding domain-containing protein [Rhizobium sp. 11_C7_N12_5]|uniref:AlbA family DNA-binding domain-containing protein n=1 Tax=Rhizobium sp. 11_C7_N12_5 TaxID=3240770 RepID=UPI003F22A921